MLFSVEFLRHVEGQAEPEVMIIAAGLASDLHAAKNLAVERWRDAALAAGADGYRIVEDTEGEVFIWWAPETGDGAGVS